MPPSAQNWPNAAATALSCDTPRNYVTWQPPATPLRIRPGMPTT